MLRLEALLGDLLDVVVVVLSPVGRHDGCVRRQREVDPRVRDQVGLELRQVHVERTVEPQGRSDAVEVLKYYSSSIMYIDSFYFYNFNYTSIKIEQCLSLN